MPRDLGAVDEELAQARALEMRLEPELRALKALGLSHRDWRQLTPPEVTARSQNAHAASPEHRRLVATAIFVGTAQACFRGSYWAPSYGSPGAAQISCRHLRPVSRLYSVSKVPRLESDESRFAESVGKITCHARCHPLEASARASRTAKHQSRRVAMVHFTGAGDARSEWTRSQHLFEDQLFLRTTYFHASERMASDIGEPVGAAVDAGGLIYTPDVGVLRGSLEEGAPWSADPARVDVIWVGLPPRPLLGEQEQYAREEDAASVAATVERVFAVAASRGAEVLVLPPLGCGTHGCRHPVLDIAQLLREAVGCYGHHFAEVAFASDSPAHFLDDGWRSFTDALLNGRPPIEHTAPTQPPPFSILRKSAAALAEKKLRVLQGAPRLHRDTFL